MNAILTVTCTDGPILSIPGIHVPVQIGAAGMRRDKTEGDHATPTGSLPLRRVFYRADRIARPETTLPCEPIARDDGWCDAPAHADYNTLVRLPHPASCEALWRDDRSYDLMVVLGWNDSPPVSGRGSAIFLHLPTVSGVTEGCIAMTEDHLRLMLSQGLKTIEVVE